MPLENIFSEHKKKGFMPVNHMLYQVLHATTSYICCAKRHAHS